MTRVRWFVLSLILFATTVNYLDRIVFSVLIKVIREDMHINDMQYGYLTGAFTLAYAFGFLLMGKFVDKYGTKIGYAVSVFFWSLAAVAHAWTRIPLHMGFARALLGFSESGNFPSAIKAVTEWFPKKDRAFATGIFNAGTNVASMVGPPLFVWMAGHYGWRASFLITGALGFLWLAVWMLYYRQPKEHAGVNGEELAYIHSDPEEVVERKLGWADVLRHKEAWGFGFAKFFTDPVWWFYLYWLPPYLYDVRKFNLTETGWALPVVYIMADFGSVGGGWLSGFLMRRGWDNAKARKATMLLCAVSMPVAVTAVFAGNPVVAILLISLATSAHQGWSANLYTTTSDMFPKNAVASVTGFGGFMGALNGFVFSAVLPGYIVTNFGYTPIFMIMGTMHLIGYAVVHFTMGNMKRIEFE